MPNVKNAMNDGRVLSIGAVAVVAGVGLLAGARGSAARNDAVVSAWAAGRKAKGRSLKTDGRTLWSYALVIGETDPAGYKIVYDYTAPDNWDSLRGRRRRLRSKTTSQHVSMAKRYAQGKPELVVKPPQGGSRAGRWVQSSRWDAIGCRTDMTAMLDGYGKSNVAGRRPWGTRSEARADLRANYDGFVAQLAEHYGVSESKVRKECSGMLSSTYDEYIKPDFDWSQGKRETSSPPWWTLALKE